MLVTRSWRLRGYVAFHHIRNRSRYSFESKPRIAVPPLAFCSFTAISSVVPLRSNQDMKLPAE